MRVLSVLAFLCVVLAGCAGAPPAPVQAEPEEEIHPRTGSGTVEWDGVLIPDSGAIHVDVDDRLTAASVLGLRTTGHGPWGMMLLEGDPGRPLAAFARIEGDYESTLPSAERRVATPEGYMETAAGRISGAARANGAVGQQPSGGNLTAVIWGAPGSTVAWHPTPLTGAEFSRPDVPPLDDVTYQHGTNASVVADLEARTWVYGAWHMVLSGDEELIQIDHMAAVGRTAIGAHPDPRGGWFVAQTTTLSGTAQTRATGAFAGGSISGEHLEMPNEDPGCLPDFLGNCIPYWGTYAAASGPGGADDVVIETLRADPGVASMVVAFAFRITGVELANAATLGAAQEAD